VDTRRPSSGISHDKEALLPPVISALPDVLPLEVPDAARTTLRLRRRQAEQAAQIQVPDADSDKDSAGLRALHSDYVEYMARNYANDFSDPASEED
jgi:hypothetical protein